MLNIQPDTTGDYPATFLARYPDDNYLCDDKSGQWHEWYEYKLDDNNVPAYGARMLFSPKRKSNLKKYILWFDSVHLTDTKYFTHGPFNYDAHDNIIQLNQYFF